MTSFICLSLRWLEKASEYLQPPFHFGSNIPLLHPLYFLALSFVFTQLRCTVNFEPPNQVKKNPETGNTGTKSRGFHHLNWGVIIDVTLP